MGPCAKVTVRCRIVSKLGEWVAENWCRSPQPVCPREPGEGYEKCKTVCRQIGHAETMAALIAGENARGGTAYIKGHSRVCETCMEALARVGIERIVLESDG